MRGRHESMPDARLLLYLNDASECEDEYAQPECRLERDVDQPFGDDLLE